MGRLKVGWGQRQVGPLVARRRGGCPVAVVVVVVVVVGAVVGRGKSLACCRCWASVQPDAGWLSLANQTRLVGLDVGAESILVGHILDVSVDSIGVSVAVRATNNAVLVALLLTVLAVSAVVLGVEVEGERLSLAGRCGLHLLLLDVLLVLLLLDDGRRPWRGRRLVPVCLGGLLVVGGLALGPLLLLLWVEE